jgi:hypothetical protein
MPQEPFWKNKKPAKAQALSEALGVRLAGRLNASERRFWSK